MEEEISENISPPHIVDPEEDIQIFVCEEKHSSYSLQKFSSNSLNFVHSLLVTVSETVEEFDFSIYNDVFGVHISNINDIQEIRSYYKTDPFTLINLEIPINSSRITCTENQNFEEGENCSSTVSVEQSFGSDMNHFGSDLFSDLIICDLGFNIQ